jgi:hypothetical protein
MTMDFDSEGFGQLLSEALRAGPGSPAWHDAVEKVRSGGVTGSEDYALLLAARQNLESGKGFRRIRAGPAFTARVMAAVESAASAGGRARRNWTVGIILILAAAAALVAAVLLVRMLMPAGPVARQTLADLESQTFASEVWSIRFNGEAPAGWRTIGSLTPSFNGEMSPPASAGDQDYQGCGIVTRTGLASDRPAAIEVILRLGEPTDQVIAQVFVTDQPDFSSDRGISPHELTWTLQPLPAPPRKGNGGGVGSRRQFEPQVVLPDGTFASTGQNVPKPRDTITIRLTFNQQFAVVESDGKRLYAGPHQLSADRPRYVGVRFLRRGEVMGKDLCGVQSVRISQNDK